MIVLVYQEMLMYMVKKNPSRTASGTATPGVLPGLHRRSECGDLI